MSRVRLLYVVGNFVTGGAERHLLEMWRRIDRTRFEVQIACLKNEGAFAPEVAKLGLPIRDLDVGRRLYDLRGARGLLRLVGLIREFRPDIVHGYLFGPNLFAALAGRACGVPVVLVAKRNVDAFESPRQVAVQRLAHRLATHVTAVSEAAARSSIALGVPASKVSVIANGVDVARFHTVPPPPAEAGTRGRPLIGSVGCLEARKDYGNLLDALATLRQRGRDVDCVVLGEGRERHALEQRIAALGLEDRVRLLGERSDVDRWLPVFDVFVLPSREEGIPNALLEAMAAGRPSVATAVGGTPEVMQDGRSGWLVPAQSPIALADALEQALADPAEADRRGRAARQSAETEHGIDAMVRRHEALYVRLLENGSRA